MSVNAEIGKEKILKSAKYQFRQAGYSISDEKLKPSSFDFIAKKNYLSPSSNPIKLIIRVLAELDYFKKNTSLELQFFSKLIQGNPLLIAHSATGKEIEDATLYRRHNVPAISLRTLQLFLRSELPKYHFRLEKFAYRGGIHIRLSPSQFTRRKNKMGRNLTKLADEIGISRQSLYNYEKGISSPKIDNYQKIEKVMGTDLKESIDIFQDQNKPFTEHAFKEHSKPRSQLQKEIDSYLEEKDFHIIWFRAEPIDGMSIDNQNSIKEYENLKSLKSIFTGVTSSDVEKDQVRMKLLKKLSDFLNKSAIWFDEEEYMNKSQKRSKSSFFTTLSVSELERMRSEEFLEFLDRAVKSQNMRQKYSLSNPKTKSSKGN